MNRRKYDYFLNPVLYFSRPFLYSKIVPSYYTLCTIALYLDKEQAIFSFNERIQVGTLTNRPYMKRPKRFVSEVLGLERLDHYSNGSL